MSRAVKLAGSSSALPTAMMVPGWRLAHAESNSREFIHKGVVQVQSEGSGDFDCLKLFIEVSSERDQDAVQCLTFDSR